MATSHLPHLEDLIFLQGVEGLNRINRIFDRLQQGTLPVSIKYDGLSVFIGVDDKGAFCARNNIFNKESVRYHSLGEIERSGLNSGLKVCLKCIWSLAEVLPPDGRNIYQGDLMFCFASDIPCKYRPGSNSIWFQPNTIEYELLGAAGERYANGIAWHSVYNQDLQFQAFAGQQPVFRTKRFAHLPTLLKYEPFYLRKAVPPDDLDLEWGVGLGRQALAAYNAPYRGEKPDLDIPRDLYNFVNEIQDLKELAINSLNQFAPHNIRTFLNLKSGGYWRRIPTMNEGYVVADPKTGQRVKLVRRDEFSAMNFSDAVKHGWE